MQTPRRPTSARAARSSRGKPWSRSQADACGSISDRAKSRARAWISRCSAVSSKSTSLRLVGGDLLGLWLELVADAEPRLDERVTRRGPVDLLPEPADEHVDRPVAVGLAPAPHLLQQLVARHHAAAVERERVEQPELGRREPGAVAVDEGLNLAGIDPQLLDLDRIAAPLLGGTHAPASCGADPRDELAHRERLDEIVVGADLECVHAVVLRSP